MSLDWDEIKQKLQDTLRPFDSTELTKEDMKLLPYIFNVARIQENIYELITNLRTDNLSYRCKTNLMLMYFLMIFETVFVYWVNGMCYYLIREEHHDLFDEIRRKFVTSIYEITYISLSVKVQFLLRHGHGYVNKIENRDLRNAIAHQNYLIDEDGNVNLLKKGKGSIIISVEEIEENINNMLKLNVLTAEVNFSKMGISMDEFVELVTDIGIDEFEKNIYEILDEKNKK